MYLSVFPNSNLAGGGGISPLSQISWFYLVILCDMFFKSGLGFPFHSCTCWGILDPPKNFTILGGFCPLFSKFLSPDFSHTSYWARIIRFDMPILYYISLHISVFQIQFFFRRGGGKFPLFLKFLDSTKLYCVIHFLSQVWGSLPIHAHAKAFNTP